MSFFKYIAFLYNWKQIWLLFIMVIKKILKNFGKIKKIYFESKIKRKIKIVEPKLRLLEHEVSLIKMNFSNSPEITSNLYRAVNFFIENYSIILKKDPKKFKGFIKNIVEKIIQSDKPKQELSNFLEGICINKKKVLKYERIWKIRCR